MTQLRQGGIGNVGVKTNIQAIARACNVKVNQVIYSTDTVSTLDGRTVLYDKPTQTIWGVPDGIPTGAVIVSVLDETLTYEVDSVSSSVELVDISSVRTKDLAATSGAGLVGTTHRGNLVDDLAALDRRVSGRTDEATTILNSGLDTMIDADFSVASSLLPAANTVVDGRGGIVTETTGKAANFRLVGTSTKAVSNVSFNNIKAIGSSLSTDDTNAAVEAYAVFTQYTENMFINGVRSLSGNAGGVYLSQSTNAIVNGVVAKSTVFHPGLARAGYAVLTDNAKESIITNVTFNVSASPDGRHLLYLSSGSGGDYTGNTNVIANNLVGKWSGRDDRNQWFANIRTGKRLIINNYIQEGGNGGVAFNHENGPITDYILSNGNVQAIAYDTSGVYGVSQINGATEGYKSYRWLITDQVVQIIPKDTTITRANCIAFSLAGSDGMLSDCVITAPGESSPILVQDAVSNVTISNIHDNIASGSSSTVPLIAFAGSSASNINVRGITTSRSPTFLRLGVVTDLTVDFMRKSRITTSGAGATSKVDVESIVSSVSLSATSATIVFPTHVTQKAVEGAIVRAYGGQYNIFISAIGTKTLTINIYTPSGVVVNPQTTSLQFEVILNS